MPKFAANLTTMFTEAAPLERFAAAAAAGFRAVEYLFPYGDEPAQVRGAIEDASVSPILINTPPGEQSRGERGLASLAGRRADFEECYETALRYVEVIQPRGLHVMAGIGGERATFVANLKHAAARAPTGLTLLIEPINNRDIPGYHLSTTRDALTVLDAVGADNLRLQLDLYHCQIMEGDLSTRLRALLPHIGHIQIAGVPDRHEPNIGEVNYPYLFDLLDDLGYDGFVGCEYRPRKTTTEGLDWFAPYRERQ